MRNLREQLKSFMYERNMTLDIASKFFGISIAAISKYLNGKTDLNPRNEYRVKQRMGIND